MSELKIPEEKRQKIYKICEQLASDGENVTTRAVLEISGGSSRTVTPLVKDWKASKTSTFTLDPEEELPPHLNDVIEKAVSYIASSFNKVAIDLANERIDAGLAETNKKHSFIVERNTEVMVAYSTLEHELDKVKSTLEMKNDLIIRLDADIKEKKSEISNFNDALHELEGSLKQALKEKGDFQHLHKLAQERIKTLEQEKTDQEQRLKSASHAANETKHQLRNAQAKISELETQSVNDKEDISNRDARIVQLEEAQIEIKQRMEFVLNEQSKKHESDLKEHLVENDTLKSQIINLEKQSHSLKSLYKVTKESLDKLDARLEQRNEQLQGLIRVETEFKALKPALADKDAEIELLNKRVSDLQIRLDESDGVEV